VCVHKSVGAWLSLVEHSVRDRGVGGSNPLAPTNFLIFLRESAELSLAGHSVSASTFRARNRVAGASNPAGRRNHSRFLASVSCDPAVPGTRHGKRYPVTLPGTPLIVLSRR